MIELNVFVIGGWNFPAQIRAGLGGGAVGIGGVRQIFCADFAGGEGGGGIGLRKRRNSAPEKVKFHFVTCVV